MAEDGRLLLSVGADGRLSGVDVLEGEDDSAAPLRPWSHRLVSAGSSVLTAAAVSSDRAWLATGQESESGAGVWVCSLDGRTGKPTGVPKLVARFTLPVRELQWHPTLPLLGVAADDGKLAVLDRSSDVTGPRRRDFPTHGHGGLRCLAFDPRGELFAAAFASGSLSIYTLRDSIERFTCPLWPKTVIGKERLTLAWRPDGSALALPGEAAVRLARREDVEGSVRGQRSPPRGHSAFVSLARLEGGHRHPTTTVAWCSGGHLMASASCDCIAIWLLPPPVSKEPLSSGKLAQVCKLDVAPVTLMWNGDLAVLCGTQAGSWARLPAPSEEELRALRCGGAGASPEKAAAEEAEDGQGEAAENRPDASAEENAPKITRQSAFQPGATQQSKRRYLSWNDYGSLKFFPAHGKVSGTGKVAVEYTRERGRSAIREVTAPLGLELGAIGPGLFALGSNATSRNGNLKPRVNVHLATPWTKPSFEHVLPTGERIEALAVGRSFVAAFTSPQRLLRIHTLAGLPVGVLSMSGPVVCLVGFEDLLFCVTEVPGASNVEPALEFALYGVASKERLAGGALPLSEASALRWAGFSVEGMPLILDTAGALRALALCGRGAPLLAPSAGEWLPVASLEDGGSHLWPVCAESGVLMCAETKPGEEPGLSQGVKLKQVSFQLPLGAGLDETEKLLRGGFLSGHLHFAAEAKLLPEARRKTALDNAALRRARGTDVRQVLKLFEGFSKLNEVERALEVVESFGRALGVEGQQELQLLAEASRMAVGAGRSSLEERVVELRSKRVEQQLFPSGRGPSVLDKQGDAPADQAEEVAEEDDEGDENEEPEAEGQQPQGVVRPLEETGGLPPAQRLRVE